MKNTVYLLLGFVVLQLTLATELYAQESAEPSIKIENQKKTEEKYLVAGKSWIKYGVRGDARVHQGLVREVFSEEMVIGADTVAYDDVEVIYGTVGNGDVLNGRRAKPFYKIFFITAGVSLLLGALYYLASSSLFDAFIVFLQLFLGLGLPFGIIALALFIKSQQRLIFPQLWRFVKLKS